ncbi:DMT family transporter [Acinetobacter sp. NIPH 1852]|uniref:DMT family transporter n=1 Tax=Acinetobacter sp. NIPH 1852 TaxID=2923428 RepID=UPI001F4AEC39|nr:DMT family transporter [Acinetobacter sp. NIPH 1852]MCH7309155.1 DMT family transporter [Acinetobacter sp. NIPH 1852]
MTVRTQGYVFVFITMCIWGGFTIFSRLNAHWHISAWDLVAMRFAIAFTILMPILIYKKDLAFLWHPRAVILALTGGLAYCFTVYTAFLHAPAAHAAIFLNGFIPLCTAVAAYVFFKQTFDKHTWLSLIIMLSALAVMSYLMLHEQASSFGLGDLLFFFSAVWWGLFTVLLKQWQLSAWHAMASVAIWSALIYLPIYLLFIPKHFQEVEAVHLLVQGLFHGVLVVIVATLTYIAAIQRLGAFKTGSIVTLAPFIAAVLAVPLLNEPLSVAVACGLVGMAIGALQPWRWFRQDSLSKQLAQQKKD